MKKLALIFFAAFTACSQVPTAFPQVGEPYAITSAPGEHMLASYFGINSWSPDGRYVSVLETNFSGRLVERTDTAVIALVDLQDNNRLIPISKTTCWNFQEATMFHWLPGEDGLCAFNDCRDGRFVAVIYNWKTGEERIIDRPISAVDQSGTWAISINYSRLRLCRPDYGYAGDGQDALADVVYPENDGLFLVNLKTGESRLLLSIEQAKDKLPQIKKEDGLAYFCHTAISPNAKKIFFLGRTVSDFNRQIKTKGYIYDWNTEAFTYDIETGELRRCFPDGWEGSHFNWKDDQTLAVTARWNAKHVWAHTVFKVGEEDKVVHLAPGILDFDGHCTFSPNGRFLSTDGYWNKDGYRSWVLVRLEDHAIISLGRFFVPDQYKEQYSRCDLHPRWSPDGTQIGFNSVHEGSRQVYLRNVKWKNN